MYRSVLLVSIGFLATEAFGQLTLPGDCNFLNASYVQNLNITQMFGKWNQIARIDNPIEKGDCSTLTIGGDVNATGIPTSVRFVQSEVVNKTRMFANGTILRHDDAPGLYTLAFDDGVSLDFVVQATNYTGHAILYSCASLSNNLKSVYAWQYDRSATLSSSQQTSINQIIVANPDLRNSTWRLTSHDSKVCGGAGTLKVPQILLAIALVFVGKEFV